MFNEYLLKLLLLLLGSFVGSTIYFESESESEVDQSCLTLCDPMDCSLPGSSVHEIFQVRILEWVVISFSRGSSQPRDQTHVPFASCIGRDILYRCVTWKAPYNKGILQV